MSEAGQGSGGGAFFPRLSCFMEILATTAGESPPYSLLGWIDWPN